MKRIHWFPNSLPCEEACPLCNSSGTQVILEAVDYLDETVTHKLARCNQCQSCFYTGLNEEVQSEHYEGSALFPNVTKLSIELQAGMQLFADVINRVPADRFNEYLEVGCGSGLGVDFVRTHLNKTAIGSEPSVYGIEGGKELDIQIYTEYLSNIAELADKKFGLIASFEVIEHTHSPAEFVAEIRKHLAPDGILVLSTPNASIVQEQLPESEVYPPLFPGEHKIILSQEALENILRNAGLTFTHSASTPNQLVLYASAEPFELGDNQGSKHYSDYLVKRIARFDAEGKSGYAPAAFVFRLVAELVGRGDFERAPPYIERLEKQLNITTEEDLETLVGQTKSHNWSSLNEYGERTPYYTGTALYFLGLYYWIDRKDSHYAYKLFQAASDIIKVEISIDAQLFLWPASLLPNCKAYAGFAALEAKETRKGMHLLREALKEDQLDRRLKRRARKLMLKGAFRMLRNKISGSRTP